MSLFEFHLKNRIKLWSFLYAEEHFQVIRLLTPSIIDYRSIPPITTPTPRPLPLGARRKLNEHKTFKRYRSSEHLM